MLVPLFLVYLQQNRTHHHHFFLAIELQTFEEKVKINNAVVMVKGEGRRVMVQNRNTRGIGFFKILLLIINKITIKQIIL